MSGMKESKPPRGLTITVQELHECWTKFQLQYPTDEDCIEGILLMGKFDTVACKACGNTEKNRESGSPVARCKQCNKQVYLFKGTFFERMRKPKAYLAVLWLRSEQIGISSNRLARLVHVAQSTAFEIQKKLDNVIFEAMMQDAFEAYSGQFRAVMTKRSSETPARQHAEAEQDLIDAAQRSNSQSYGKTAESPSATTKENADPDASSADNSAEPESESESEPHSEANVIPKIDCTDSNTQSELAEIHPELQLQILNGLSHENAVHIDALCETLNAPVGDVLAALTAMQINKEVIDVGALTFKKFAHSSTNREDLLGLAKFFKIDEEAMERFVKQVEHVFHGISRKNLQLYLAWFWSLVGVVFKDPAKLVLVCSKFRHLTRHDIRNFVTEPSVKIIFE